MCHERRRRWDVGLGHDFLVVAMISGLLGFVGAAAVASGSRRPCVSSLFTIALPLADATDESGTEDDAA